MKRYFACVVSCCFLTLVAVKESEEKLINDVKDALKRVLEVKESGANSTEVEKLNELLAQRTYQFMDVVEQKAKMEGEGALTLENVQKVLDALVPLLKNELSNSRFLYMRTWLRGRVKLVGNNVNSEVRLTLEDPALTSFCVGFVLLVRRPDILVIVDQNGLGSKGNISWADVPSKDITRSMVRAVNAIDKVEEKNYDQQILWDHVFQPFFFEYTNKLIEPQKGGLNGLNEGAGESILKHFSREVDQLQKEGKITKNTVRLVAEKTVETMCENTDEQLDSTKGADKIISFADVMDKALVVAQKEQTKKEEWRQQQVLGKVLENLTASLKALHQ